MDIKTISEKELMEHLHWVITQISTGLTTYRVICIEEDYSFILASTEGGRTFSEVWDEEYGWPYPIDADLIKNVSEIRPGTRRHPIITHKDQWLAISLQETEFEKLYL